MIDSRCYADHVRDTCLRLAVTNIQWEASKGCFAQCYHCLIVDSIVLECLLQVSQALGQIHRRLSIVQLSLRSGMQPDVANGLSCRNMISCLDVVCLVCLVFWSGPTKQGVQLASIARHQLGQTYLFRDLCLLTWIPICACVVLCMSV